MQWIESHQIIVYLIFATIVGTMPELPPGSGFWARWGYGVLHAACMNWKTALGYFKVEVPPVNEGPK